MNVMQLNNPPAKSTPIVLDNLPTPSPDEVCPRRARMQIDLMLLAIEALDLSGSEAILLTAHELDLQIIIPNRVSFGGYAAPILYDVTVSAVP